MSEAKKSAWDGYRRWRKIGWIAKGIAIPIWVGLLFFGESGRDLGSYLFPVFFVCVILNLPCEWFDCPKCGNHFFFKPFKVYGPFKRTPTHCVHCGLAIWAEPPEKAEVYPIPRRSAPLPDPAIAESIRLKNFLTLVLRDDPGAIGLKLNSEGWTAVDQLLARAGKYRVKLTCEALEKLVGDGGGSGFEWNKATQRIRAVRP